MKDGDEDGDVACVAYVLVMLDWNFAIRRTMSGRPSGLIIIIMSI